MASPTQRALSQRALSQRAGLGADSAWREAVRLLVLLVIVGIVLYPLVWMVGSSFKSQPEILSNTSAIPRDFTPGNYSEGWSHFDVSFGRFFVNSILIAGLTVLGNMASCLLAAYAFARMRFQLSGFWFAVMIGTLLLP